MSKQSVVVIGAGIVGTTSALELQRRGYQVVLIDKGAPGEETSFGNAGVLSDASIIVINNPELPFRLPRMLFNTSAALRYSLFFVLSRLPWVLRFLFFANKDHMHYAGRALRELQLKSLQLHKMLIQEANAQHMLSETGWLKLYGSEYSFQACQRELDFLSEMGVRYKVCSAEDLQELEPGLKAPYYKGVLLTDTCSVNSPEDLTKSYARLFERLGGRIIQAKVGKLTPGENQRWTTSLGDNENIESDAVVIAAGPWSAEIARWLNYNIPMAWERGYHTHLAPDPDKPLTRPIHDVERGFVAAPHKEGTRILTGVELTHRDAKPNYKQLKAAVRSAREIMDLGAEDAASWLGCRPTLVDSLPAVGPATRHKGLWFNFGHQHVGMSTSTGCAQILADLMDKKTPSIDHEAFRPDRFNI
jgi:D-amino-acid dehydrogenase